MKNNSPCQRRISKGMSQALAMARRGLRQGEVPVGAALMCENKIIASAHNGVERWNNPLAHCEVLTLLQGIKKINRVNSNGLNGLCEGGHGKARNSRYLECCWLYVTLEPCSLCWAAINRYRLAGVYFGAYQSTNSNGANRHVNDMVCKAHPVPGYGGFYEEPCEKLLTQFFQSKRYI